MKVQFVINQPEEPVVEKKKEEPPKIVKKVDTTFDLLSLFQKAIENVNDEVIHEKEVDIETVIKEPKIRKEFSIPKQRRVEDMEGRITGVELQAGKIVIKHTKIGESTHPFIPAEIPIDSHGEMDLEPIHEAEIEEYRGRLLHSHLLGQISILN
jgi:Cu/Ag efflux protein CusF